jgi:hypothetical protein
LLGFVAAVDNVLSQTLRGVASGDQFSRPGQRGEELAVDCLAGFCLDQIESLRALQQQVDLFLSTFQGVALDHLDGIDWKLE